MRTCVPSSRQEKCKIKHATLCCDYTNGDLKSVDISSKIVSLQCSWVRQLFDNNFYQSKVIPSILRKSYLRTFPKYYQEMLYK